MTLLLFNLGKLNPTTAFMSGKLKMEGNLGKALALEKIMKKMNQRGYHTSARLATFNNSGNYISTKYSYIRLVEVRVKVFRAKL